MQILIFMPKLRADLHNHIAIGFQDYWLKLQGYKNKNLLQLATDKCLERGIDICAVTSEEFDIPENSVHDRLNYLKNFYASKLPSEYETGTLGSNILIVSKGEKPVYFINGQTVIVIEEGKRFDYLVVGSNKVPNSRNFRDTHAYCKDHGLIRIAEHPKAEHHFGIGFKRLEEQLDDYHAIEGHNGQMIIPEAFSFLPFVGKYNNGVNREAIEFAIKYNKPFIASSDAHSILGIGIAHIKFEDSKLDKTREDRFIESLTHLIERNDFETEAGYQNPFSWLKWTTQFILGIRSGEV